MKPINRLIIDGELIAYQAAVKSLEEVQVNEEEWSYVMNELDARSDVEGKIDDLRRELQADLTKSVVCFGGLENWRRDVMREYKAERQLKRKPLGYLALISWMRKKYRCMTIGRLEADDVIGILATGKMAGSIIVSEDKDMRQIPGLLYDPRHPELGVQKITKDQADLWHLRQTLTGDSTDGYKGCPGVGPKGADVVLACDDKWLAVVEAFNKAGLTEEDALVNARVARILRSGEYDLSTSKVIHWTPAMLAGASNGRNDDGGASAGGARRIGVGRADGSGGAQGRGRSGGQNPAARPAAAGRGAAAPGRPGGGKNRRP